MSKGATVIHADKIISRLTMMEALVLHAAKCGYLPKYMVEAAHREYSKNYHSSDKAAIKILEKELSKPLPF